MAACPHFMLILAVIKLNYGLQTFEYQSNSFDNTIFKPNLGVIFEQLGYPLLNAESHFQTVIKIPLPELPTLHEDQLLQCDINATACSYLTHVMHMYNQQYLGLVHTIKEHHQALHHILTNHMPDPQAGVPRMVPLGFVSDIGKALFGCHHVV